MKILLWKSLNPTYPVDMEEQRNFSSVPSEFSMCWIFLDPRESAGDIIRKSDITHKKISSGHFNYLEPILYDTQDRTLANLGHLDCVSHTKVNIFRVNWFTLVYLCIIFFSLKIKKKKKKSEDFSCQEGTQKVGFSESAHILEPGQDQRVFSSSVFLLISQAFISCLFCVLL